MDRGAAVALTAVVGGMVALQGPVNSHLGRTIGTFQAAFFSFGTGTIILGACYVSLVLVTVRTLGAGGIVAASIAGQLTMSVVIDQFGLLGLDKDPISAMKVVGVLLLAVGTLLVIRG